ncbi:hypothetical protein Kisp01_70990 [Kineosporia sp. NBRC 101677]|nr:hypothetical protein Kisp01_70990 [Kineosporia sp. NBRC 101677]
MITPIPGIPLLVYIPGLNRSPQNTADNIAEILARNLDNEDEGTFGTQTPQGPPAPRGLTLSKTVVSGTDRPVLQVFEFDYRNLLNRTDSPSTPSVAGDALRSLRLASWGAVLWGGALRRGAKNWRAKVQLTLGLAAAFTLIFTAALSVWALLVALGVGLPWQWPHRILNLNMDPRWTFGSTVLGTTLSWALLRSKILALAAGVDRIISFVQDEDRTAGDIIRQLDHALDQLSINGWNGPVHLMGYSFGSLVLFETMFPKQTGLMPIRPVSRVESMTTVGCPIDIVRLYFPRFLDNRSTRKHVPWTNIFNAADIFSSNFMDGTDAVAGEGFAVDGVRPSSFRYTEESMGALQMFVNGKTHAGYWSDADGANSLGPLTGMVTGHVLTPT